MLSLEKLVQEHNEQSINCDLLLTQGKQNIGIEVQLDNSSFIYCLLLFWFILLVSGQTLIGFAVITCTEYKVGGVLAGYKFRQTVCRGSVEVQPVKGGTQCFFPFVLKLFRHRVIASSMFELWG